MPAPRGPVSASALRPNTALTSPLQSTPVFLPLTLQRQRPEERDRPATALPSPTPSPTPSPSPTPTLTPEERLFDPEHLVEVEIDIDPGDWDELRLQARSLGQIFGSAECRTEPPVSPYTWFPATVRVDGQEMANVGLRKKGLLGSVNSQRPSLKIKLDEYEEGQRLAGMRRMTLNNNWQDDSQVRQCLSYQLMAAAGVPSPRCNFARVRVNGRDYGIYSHIESIKKPFLARAFGDDEGNLYEATLSDFAPGWVDSFERKTNESDPDRGDLQAVIDAMAAEDDELIEAIEEVIALDEFFRFWAMETLLTHFDGYAFNQNNTYLYANPASGRIHFIPWGVDGVMRAQAYPHPRGGSYPSSVLARSVLTQRLYRHPEGQRRYLAALDELLEGVWDEDAILDEISRMERLVRPGVLAAKRGAFGSQLSALRRYVRDRRGAIEAELARGPARLPDPANGLPCRVSLGRVQADIELAWEAAPEPLEAEIVIGETRIPFREAEAQALFAGDSPLEGRIAWPAHPAIQLGGPLTQRIEGWGANDLFLASLLVDPARYPEGGTIPVDGHQAFGRIFRQVRGQNDQVWTLRAGLLWGGELHLDAAGLEPGAPVTGRIDAEIAGFTDE